MIRCIAALDQKNGIGKHGGQPWKLPKDEAHFARLTKLYGAKIVVGKTTFDTFNGPLAGRTNYVVTHDQAPIAGAQVVHDLEQFLEDATDDIWVIGGGKIFELALKHSDELHLTHIAADFGCDTFFPEYPDFELREKSEVREQNGLQFYYATYVRTT